MGVTSPQSQAAQRCRCCDDAIDSRLFEVVSWRDESSHRYAVCPGCESINLHGYTDSSPYHGEGYEPTTRPEPRANTLLLQAAGLSAAWVVKGRAGPWLYRLGNSILPTWTGWFAGFGVRPSSHILDVGSGRGALLLHLRRMGFRSLTGIHCELLDLEAYATQHDADAVIFNHSLEHVDDPARAPSPSRTDGLGWRPDSRHSSDGRRESLGAIPGHVVRHGCPPAPLPAVATRYGAPGPAMRASSTQDEGADLRRALPLQRSHPSLSCSRRSTGGAVCRGAELVLEAGPSGKGAMAAEGSFVLEKSTRSIDERPAGSAAAVAQPVGERSDARPVGPMIGSARGPSRCLRPDGRRDLASDVRSGSVRCAGVVVAHRARDHRASWISVGMDPERLAEEVHPPASGERAPRVIPVLETDEEILADRADVLNHLAARQDSVEGGPIDGHHITG